MNTFQLKKLGAQLFGRRLGAVAREALEAELRASAPGAVTLVDIGGVALLDYTFADECFGVTLCRAAKKEYGEKYLAFKNDASEVGGYVLENISVAVAARQTCALRLFDDNAFDVLGDLPEHLEETLRAVMARSEPPTALELADEEELTLVATHSRVYKLRGLNLLRASDWMPYDGGGARYTGILK